MPGNADLADPVGRFLDPRPILFCIRRAFVVVSRG